MPLDAATSGLIGVAIGAIAGIAGTVSVAVITRRSEEKRHFRELAMNAAIQNWERSQELAKLWSEAGRSMRVAPLDHYVVHMMLLCKLFDEGDLAEEDFRAQFKRIHAILRAIRKETDVYSRPPGGVGNGASGPSR